MENEKILPKWINKDFIQNTLQKYLGHEKNIKLLKYQVTKAAGDGENFSSEMYRMEVDVEEANNVQTYKIMIKTLPNNLYVRESISASNAFGKESRMLGTIVPEMEKVLRDAGEPRIIGADLVYASTDPNTIIMMRDLTEQGFDVADRLNGIDLDHCKMVMKYLADFHASSVVVFNQHPDWIDYFRFGMWDRGNKFSPRQFIEESFQGIIQRIDKWSGDTKYSSLLKPLQSKVVDVMHDTLESGSHAKVRVLNHGDLWTNNIMFRYNEDMKLDDLRFVDLQLSFYNKPVMDILYFFFTSPTNSVRLAHIDGILEAYEKRWSFITKKLNLPTEYIQYNVRKDFFENISFGFAMLFSVFPIVVAPKGKVNLGTSEADRPSTAESLALDNERIQKVILETMPLFIENKIFSN